MGILNKLFRVFVVVSLFVVTGFLGAPAHAQVTTITNRSLQISSSIPGQTANYIIALTATIVPTLGSIKIEFCGNSPLFSQPCTPPAGFNIAAAALVAQSGETGFSIHPTTTANMLVLTRTPAASNGLPAVYELTNVVNAASEGTQYARYSTYAADNGTGSILDFGSVAYALNERFGVTTEVPPYLEFCLGTTIPTVDCSGATGNYVLLGDFSPDTSSSGQVQMVVGTNAANGYTIRVNGNAMASGANILPALVSPTSSTPGNSQFGINLRANTNPASGLNPSGTGSGSPAADYNIPNKYTFRPGDIVASKSTVEDYRKYTVTYLVNISRAQPPGIYSGTYTYVALGNF